MRSELARFLACDIDWSEDLEFIALRVMKQVDSKIKTNYIISRSGDDAAYIELCASGKIDVLEALSAEGAIRASIKAAMRVDLSTVGAQMHLDKEDKDHLAAKILYAIDRVTGIRRHQALFNDAALMQWFSQVDASCEHIKRIRSSHVV